jgi:serine/threonine-protein kinase
LRKILIVFGGAFALVLLVNFVVMPWYVKHNTLVTVPSVIGLGFEEAKSKLDAAGLEGLQSDLRYDPSKPIGTVIEQNPPADQVVKDGRRIYLIISGGEQLYDVPNLVGRTLREAKFMLSQRNLETQEVEYRPSAQYPAGIILSQLEPTGSKVKKGTMIGLIVSTGMESGDIKVPDITGKNIEEAKKLIVQNKLSIGKINYQPTTTVALNSVIDQYPKANTMAKENQKVDLFVNREVKKKIIIEGEGEEQKMDKIVPEEENNDEKKEEIKKDEKKKEEKSTKSTDKKEEKVKPSDKDKKEEKKITPKDKKESDKKDEGGTKF